MRLVSRLCETWAGSRRASRSLEASGKYACVGCVGNATVPLRRKNAGLRLDIGDVNRNTCMQAARGVETTVCRLSEGLPKEADDANMVEPVQEVEVFRAEFVLPAPPKGEDADGAVDGGTPGTPHDSSEGDAGLAHGAARINQQVVSALEELDDSDAEPESKSGSTYDEAGNRYPNKPLRIWRTRRDRTVWLKELRRAELAENLPGLVMCCAALLDRSRPMQVRHLIAAQLIPSLLSRAH